MSEGNTAGKLRTNRDQGLAEIAQDQALRIRYAIAMGRDLAVEDKDVPVREGLTQMVVCPPVAEAEFKDGASHIAYKINSAIEATALCLKPANEAIQTGHG